jgi:phage baseplate assembly protein W
MPITTLNDFTPSIYGSGFSIPLRLDDNETNFMLAEEEEKVKCSIRAILGTDSNERPYVTKNGVPFGTAIRRSLFEPVFIVIDTINFEVPRALNIWEPRIMNVSVVAAQDTASPTQVNARISFTYRATNRADNMVIPFMTRTGT